MSSLSVWNVCKNGCACKLRRALRVYEYNCVSISGRRRGVAVIIIKTRAHTRGMVAKAVDEIYVRRVQRTEDVKE